RRIETPQLLAVQIGPAASVVDVAAVNEANSNQPTAARVVMVKSSVWQPAVEATPRTIAIGGENRYRSSSQILSLLCQVLFTSHSMERYVIGVEHEDFLSNVSFHQPCIFVYHAFYYFTPASIEDQNLDGKEERTGIMTEDVDGHVLDKYELQKRLGKGAYGIVWKAIDRRTKDVVALKKIRIKVQKLTLPQTMDIYLVFEYMEADLHNVIKKMTILKDVHKQYIMCQLFRAIRFLHSGNVLHRDLKPSNVLLDADCRVKLADFGLARSLSSLEDYPEGQNMPELTEYVATRWYRSPEILLAAKRYTKGVDMWSLGCILAEMLL
ncbi:kinase domain protein, partial [Teladorsagia circumcincta]